MIRCSECKDFEKMLYADRKTDKILYYCYQQVKESGTLMGCKIFDKVPKAHPRWCPLYKEQKNGYEKTT